MSISPYAFSIGEHRVVVDECTHSPDSTTFRFTLHNRRLICTIQDNHLSISCTHEDWLPAGTLLTTLLEMFRAERMLLVNEEQAPLLKKRNRP